MRATEDQGGSPAPLKQISVRIPETVRERLSAMATEMGVSERVVTAAMELFWSRTVPERWAWYAYVSQRYFATGPARSEDAEQAPVNRRVQALTEKFAEALTEKFAEVQEHAEAQAPTEVSPRERPGRRS